MQWSTAHSTNEIGVPYFRLGNLTIKSDNPFIPASVRAQMTALKLTQFTLGTWNGDFNEHNMGADNTRTFRRIMAGLEGNFEQINRRCLSEIIFEQIDAFTRATSMMSMPVPRIMASRRRDTAPSTRASRRPRGRGRR